MAGAHCLRHQPPDHHRSAERKYGAKRHVPGNNRLCQAAGAGGICATATVQCKPATITRFKKATAEAATPAQNYKTTNAASCVPGRAAIAIWLVWLLGSRGEGFTHPTIRVECHPKYIR